MEKTQKINRIPSVIAGLMISVAIVFDLLGFGLAFIPVAGWLIASAIGVVAFLTFFLWFNFRGVSYNGTRKIALSGIGFLLELVPLLNALPAWTISTSLMILVVKGEDLASNKTVSIKTSADSAQKKTQIQQKARARQAANEESYTPNESGNSNIIPVNARQNPPLINRDFKGIASSDDSSRFIKAA